MKINPAIYKQYDIRGRYPSEINDESAYKLGRAFARHLKARKIVVARDARFESENVCHFFIQGLLAEKVKVSSLGIDSTPNLFFSVADRGFDGGAVITASHNPTGYTGIKMCGRDGVIFGLATKLGRIAKLAEKTDLIKKIKGDVKFLNILPAYYRFLDSLIDLKKIKARKLVLDSSGGSGSKMIDYVFVRIKGKDIKMNFRPGDEYPDHDLNPMLAENRASLSQTVKKQKAFLGVIWDGDGDRCLFVDEKGNFVPPYYFNCLLIKIILRKKKNIKIVIDSRSGLGLKEVIRENGGRIVVSRSGYAHFVNLMQKGKLIFGCENSGHYFFNLLLAKKKSYAYSDSIIPVLLLLEYLSENNLTLSLAVEEFRKRYFFSGEINLKLKNNFEKIMEKLKKKFVSANFEELDGLSVFSNDWFFNIRPSNTEPLIRLNIEARKKQDLNILKKKILKII